MQQAMQQRMQAAAATGSPHHPQQAATGAQASPGTNLSPLQSPSSGAPIQSAHMKNNPFGPSTAAG